MALEDAGGLPDRILMNQAIEELWQNGNATHTEDTMEQDERMERLAAQIASEENSEEGVGFVVRVKQLIPQYREQYA
eukprot:6409929-Karenia_brevis.AAC.1